MRGPRPQLYIPIWEYVKRNIDGAQLLLYGNQLTGLLPEPLLQRWDGHAFELDARGNPFSNMVGTATVTVASTGVLCSPSRDLHFTATYDAASMRAP
jgi:hypothetical protein